MFGIEVRDGHPFQFRSEVLLHSCHEIAGQPIKIDSLSEFRRYDQFPKPRIALTLPTLQFLGGLRRSTPLAVRVVPQLTQNRSAGTLAGYVSPVSPPLAGRLIRRIHRANGATLIELPSCPAPRTGTCGLLRPA